MWYLEANESNNTLGIENSLREKNELIDIVVLK